MTGGEQEGGGGKEKQEERAIPPTPRPGRCAERNAA